MIYYFRQIPLCSTIFSLSATRQPVIKRIPIDTPLFHVKTPLHCECLQRKVKGRSESVVPSSHQTTHPHRKLQFTPLTWLFIVGSLYFRHDDPNHDGTHTSCGPISRAPSQQFLTFCRGLRSSPRRRLHFDKITCLPTGRPFKVVPLFCDYSHQCHRVASSGFSSSGIIIVKFYLLNLPPRKSAQSAQAESVMSSHFGGSCLLE